MSLAKISETSDVEPQLWRGQTAQGGPLFEKRFRKAASFSARFPGGIPYSGKRVLDVGCGFGALCFHAALEGAVRVHGVDPDCRRIGFARAMLDRYFLVQKERIAFFSSGVENIPHNYYDIIVSMAAFEHIADPEEVLREMKARLAPGGRIYIGFGRLYRAPFGDHGRLASPGQRFFPWSHLVFPLPYLLRRRNRLLSRERAAACLQDIGLNGCRMREFLRIFQNSGLTVRFLRVNHAKTIWAHVLHLLALCPPVLEYFAFNIYCILECPAE